MLVQTTPMRLTPLSAPTPALVVGVERTRTRDELGYRLALRLCDFVVHSRIDGRCGQSSAVITDCLRLFPQSHRASRIYAPPFRILHGTSS
ncbi:hypothetical protein EVAR_21671_1 [Eumeta japonica]|uniref:Uncharacterized protein n=1 Tax=Eumeta variegata TaxID=151549 RepID=A0A4C1VFC6_EUMVA|nr:hypothetical protein EVAR_21671_1 [Eumeta japonica]